jgi:hypothetical protein
VVENPNFTEASEIKSRVLKALQDEIDKAREEMVELDEDEACNQRDILNSIVGFCIKTKLVTHKEVEELSSRVPEPAI